MPSDLQPVTSRAPSKIESWIVQPDFIFRAGLFLILALYLRTLAFDFVYDDLFIPISPLIQSWHGLIGAFQSDIFAIGGQAGSSYYRPLDLVFFVVVPRLTSGTPAWFHLATLLIALTVYVLSYVFGRLFFENDRLAALTSVLFALHPSKVESIAWIGSGACDGQAAIYFFAVLICYLKWWNTRKTSWLLGSVAAFCCALFTKETMVVVPGLLVLHCFLHVRQGAKLRTATWIGSSYLIVIAVYLFARRLVLKLLPHTNLSVRPTFTLVNLWSAPAATWWYVKRLFFPSGLSILYDWTEVISPSWRNFGLPLFGLLVIAALLAWAWYRTRSWRLLFLSAWFVLTLGPPIALSPGVTVHDRYLYLPSYAFCALLGFGIIRVANRWPQWRLLAPACAVLLIAAWSVSTWHESSYWDNSLSLWGRAVEIAPHNVNARVEFARLLSETNEPAALRVFDDGLRLLPDSPGLWRSRGLLLYNAGAYEEARTSLLHSLDASARFSANPGGEPLDVKYGRATVAFFLGQIDMIEGNPTAADPWLRMALSLVPENVDYERAMVANLRKQGLDAEASKYQKLVDELIASTTMKKH